MTFLINKSDPTKLILVGQSEDDKKTLRCLFDNHSVWGFYTFWESNPENRGIKEPIYKMLTSKFGNVTAYGMLNSPQGFVPQTEVHDVSKGKKYLQGEPEPELPPLNKDELFADLIGD